MGTRATGWPVDGIVQHLAKADDQAAAKCERVDGLIRVYAAASIIVIVIGISRAINGGEELGLQLNADAGRDINICPYL